MASRFWVGGSGTWDASDTTHWAATSGAAGGQSVPGSGDTVTFDGASGGGTVTPNYDMTVTSITMGAFTGTLDFSVNNNSPTISSSFSGSGSGTRTLKMGSGTWTLTGTGTCWNIFTITNLTFNAGTSTIKFTDTSNSGVQITCGGLNYYNLWFARGASTGGITISTGNNYFNEFKDTGTAGHTIGFSNGVTQTFNIFTVVGSAGNLISIGTSGSSSSHALAKVGGGIVSCDYLILAHSVATPASTWYAGANSTNNQATATAGSGWIFSAAPKTAGSFTCFM